METLKLVPLASRVADCWGSTWPSEFSSLACTTLASLVPGNVTVKLPIAGLGHTLTPSTGGAGTVGNAVCVPKVTVRGSIGVVHAGLAYFGGEVGGDEGSHSRGGGYRRRVVAVAQALVATIDGPLYNSHALYHAAGIIY